MPLEQIFLFISGVEKRTAKTPVGRLVWQCLDK
jgi:hypothetical protein